MPSTPLADPAAVAAGDGAGTQADGVGLLVGALAEAIDRVVDVDFDALAEAGLQQVMAAEERAIRRLQAHQSQLSATWSRRRAAQARTERPDDPRAGEKAARQVRNEMTDGLGITPSKAKQVTRTGHQLEHLPATAAAYADGQLTDRHVGVIDEVTAHFTGQARRDFEDELVALADHCRDAVTFGRQARRLLIERDHDAAQADLEAKKSRRTARVTQTPEGTTLLRLDTAGYHGELIHTVVDAFRTPDGAGVHRTAEQRTHDAILAAFETALRTGAASTQHGVRPQVAVVIRAESLGQGDGTADTRWTGPLPYHEVARITGDSALTRIIAGTTDLPLSVTRQVRTVPAGLWQALVLRDGGCIWEDCDAPAGWCQVAHLETAYTDHGKLSPDTAGLLCTTGPNHHAIYDNHGYQVRWTNGRPQIHTPDGQPLTDRTRGRWARETHGPYRLGTPPDPEHRRPRPHRRRTNHPLHPIPDGPTRGP